VGDGVDQDCDGADLTDGDGDGWDFDEDCDDENPAVNPDATDIVGDSVDQNCDGTDGTDYDGDGAASIASGGDDCDDLDAARSPDFEEALGDGLDNDCDDSVDIIDLYEQAGWQLWGEDEGDEVGRAIAVLPDRDGDGSDELLVGAPGDDDAGVNAGALYLFSGPLGEGEFAAGDADWSLLGGAPADGLGVGAAAVGDLNGDGVADFGVAAALDAPGGSQAGAVYVFYNTTAAGVDEADARITGGDGDALGRMARAGDQSGSGYDDLLLGAPGHDGGRGAAFLFEGPPVGLMGPADASAIFTGEVGNAQAGAVSGGEDVDGDGIPDLLLGASRAPGWTGAAAVNQGGDAYLFLGPVSGTMSMADATAILGGEATYDYAGDEVLLPGDLDGDGYADLVVGAPGHDAGSYYYSGAAYIVYGPVSASMSLADADVSLLGVHYYGDAGEGLGAPGDVDGDDLPDLLVGAPDAYAYVYDGGAYVYTYGAAHLVAGAPGAGTYDLDELGGTMWSGAYETGGRGALGGGDLDGDGAVDLVVGAYAASPDTTGYYTDDHGGVFALFGG